MTDLDTIRSRAYALAELESTVHLFCTGLVYLGTTYPYDRLRGKIGLEILAESLRWSNEATLTVDRPEEAE